MVEAARRERSSWERAGEQWWSAVRLASSLGELAVVREGVLKAVDSFRRGDVPRRLLEVSREGQKLATSKAQIAMLRIYELGAMVELGLLEDAGEIAEEVLDLAVDPYNRPFALDTVAGAWLVSGRIEAMREMVAELEGGLGAAQVAARFRRGQLARLDGDLDGAEELFRSCIEGLRGHETGAGGAAAALTELGSIMLLRRDWSEARGLFEEAEEEWSLAGRRSGQHQARGLGVRAMLGPGNVHLLSSGLNESITFAVERGLRLLESELRLARGLRRASVGEDGAEEDLNAAVYIAWESGARIHAGRCRLERRIAGFGESNDIARASRELMGDLPMLDRIRDLIE